VSNHTPPYYQDIEQLKITRAGQQIAVHMEQISRLLTPSMRLTLLMRHASNPNNCAIVSDEEKSDVDAVCETLRRLMLNPTGTVDI
jgi:hypothetical protein